MNLDKMRDWASRLNWAQRKAAVNEELTVYYFIRKNIR